MEGQIIEKSSDLVKDPYVLEFLGLEDKSEYSENELETRLINNLQSFLLELGTGYTFVARQKRFTFNEEHFRGRFSVFIIECYDALFFLI